MKHLIVRILGSGLIVALGGCNAKSETDMGSHHVTVTPGAAFTSHSSSAIGDQHTYEYTCGDVSIKIRNEELIVSGVKYGKLGRGEAVSVEDGKVFVAGAEREGSQLSGAELIETATVKESTKQLAGYAVTVRPGASFVSNMTLFGKHTFTVGKTEVSIKDDALFVNAEPYGALKPGDTVLVENSKVFVSGEAREKTE